MVSLRGRDDVQEWKRGEPLLRASESKEEQDIRGRTGVRMITNAEELSKIVRKNERNESQ